eukprot:s2308_g14.t1
MWLQGQQGSFPPCPLLRGGDLQTEAWRLVTSTHFVWQAWHLVTWSFTLCGTRGTYGIGLGLVTCLVPGDDADAAAFCVAGVAFGDIDLHFVWQVWHLVISTFTLCGRGGTCGAHLPLVTRLMPGDAADAAAFCVAGVALGDIDLHFVWQAWRLVTWSSFCVAGVALMALGWAWRLVTSISTLHNSLRVAGVALGDIDLRFVWQAWHSWSFVLCGMRGTSGSGLGLVTRLVPGDEADAAAFCVAGVAFGDTDLHFVWQVWRFDLHFVWQVWRLVTSTFTFCGRRGAFSAGSGDALGTR